MNKIIFICLMLFTALSNAQVGINTDSPDASSALEIESTTAGILIPRLTETQRDAISSPATGLMIYQTDQTTGFYYYNGSWTRIGSSGDSSTTNSYSVNTYYAELGGFVIETNSDGTHGIVVAMQDQGDSNWYKANNLVNNYSKHDTDGAQFRDWRFPTKRELNLMYQAYRLSGNPIGLNANPYWSSTQNDNSNAWRQDIHSGGQYSSSKNGSYKIRAVRSF